VTASDSNGGSATGAQKIYADLARSELEAARAESDRVEQRSAAVVATSVTLVSVLFGFASLRADAVFVLPSLSADAFYVALVSFGAASVLAIAANLPQRRRHVLAEAVRAAVSSGSGQTDGNAERTVTLMLISYIDDVRAANRVRVAVVTLALAAEIVAMLSLAIVLAQTVA
jgi:hypothetical protein